MRRITDLDDSNPNNDDDIESGEKLPLHQSSPIPVDPLRINIDDFEFEEVNNYRTFDLGNTDFNDSAVPKLRNLILIKFAEKSEFRTLFQRVINNIPNLNEAFLEDDHNRIIRFLERVKRHTLSSKERYQAAAYYSRLRTVVKKHEECLLKVSNSDIKKENIKLIDELNANLFELKIIIEKKRGNLDCNSFPTVCSLLICLVGTLALVITVGLYFDARDGEFDKYSNKSASQYQDVWNCLTHNMTIALDSAMRSWNNDMNSALDILAGATFASGCAVGFPVCAYFNHLNDKYFKDATNILPLLNESFTSKFKRNASSVMYYLIRSIDLIGLPALTYFAV